MACIYKIQNKKNGKVYIGQTMVTLENRLNRDFHGHFADAFIYKKEDYLYRSMRKYGKVGFTYEVIEEIPLQNSKELTKKLLNERERYWIAYYDSYNNGYNQTPGGNDLGKSLSEEHKKKIGLANMGKKRSKETRQKISNAKKGKLMSEEVKKLRAEKMKLKGTYYPLNRRKVGEFHHTEESKKKISEAGKGRIFSEESKRKIGESNRKAFEIKKANGIDVTHSEEQKRKISESLKRSYAEGRRKKSDKLIKIFLTYKDETKPLVDWAKEYNLKISTLRCRLNNGYSIEDALTLPIKKGIYYKNIKNKKEEK